MRGKSTVSKTLYRKYRSKSLDEVIGQKHITDILARALKQGKVTHAYLFTGPRGVGKTSVARILAHQINELPYSDETAHLDIIEIDAASNNSVEDIRDLREKVQIAPVLARKKVYIIDEVHMLSKSAFNALLKTLEEPPEHVVFILATTDVNKLPDTIISRTQRFNFRAIAPADAAAHLRYIADSEKINITDEALQLIAERGEGSFRDSISLLDQLTSLAGDKAGITTELIEGALGLAPVKLVESLLKAIEVKDPSKILALLDQARSQGVNSNQLARQLTLVIRQNMASKLHLIDLLDNLLEVSSSSQPDLKLTTVLLTAALPKTPKSVALSAPIPEVKASIKELEKQAERKKPSETTVRAKSQKASPAPPTDLDWNKLLDYTKKHHFALYSVLGRCHHELNGDELTLYTGNAFYKKKLDDTKYKTLIHTSLSEIGVKSLDIHTIPTPPPPKDSQAAAIAAIMGGGEEISIEI